MEQMIRRWSSLFLLVTLVGGCSLVPTQPSVDRAWFLLEVPPPPVTENGSVPIELVSVRVAPAFSGKGLVYRLGPYRYESDFYNEWFLNPREHVEQLLRERWIRDDGAVRLVADVRSEPGARQMDVLVTGLHGDLDGAAPGSAVVGMRVFVQEGDRNWLWELERRIPMAARSPEALVSALSLGMSELLSEIEQRLEI